MRIVAHAARRGGDADLLQHLQCPGVDGALREAFVRADGLHDLLADGEDRIERSHRFLEDHGDARATDALHAGIGKFDEDFAGEAGFPPRRRGQEAAAADP